LEVSCQERVLFKREGQDGRHSPPAFWTHRTSPSTPHHTHITTHIMDPPGRPLSKRRAAAVPGNSSVSLHKYSSDTSPTPYASTPVTMHTSTEVLRGHPQGQTVGIKWDEDGDAPSSRTSRLQIDLAECVETKTVTTTTTTKRSYPPILFRQRPLEELDIKEYPLANTPTPKQLTRFSYGVNAQEMAFFGDESRSSAPMVLHLILYVTGIIFSNKSNLFMP
jgi:hypothetical protein